MCVRGGEERGRGKRKVKFKDGISKFINSTSSRIFRIWIKNFK